MTFPQAQASQEILEGQEFFRLNTELQSGGDIYEIDTSASAFVIGPQSDLARLRVTYFDPSAPQQVSSFVVSVDDPFIGRVDAFGTQKYPLSKGPARILVSPEDIYIPEAILAQFPAGGSNALAPAKIDLLCYLEPPPNVPSKRADYYVEGRATVPNVSMGAGDFTIAAPFFRRKYASINLRNFSSSSYDYSVIGRTFTTDKNGSAYQLFTKTLLSGTIIATGDIILEVKATTHGLWDYLQLLLHGPAIDSAATQSCVKYRITFTDEEV